MTAQNPLDGLAPSDPIMALFWLGSLKWAIGNEHMLAEFRRDTGNNWQPGATPLARMFDEATGADVGFIRAFAEWHNEWIWGTENGKPIDAKGQRR